MSSEPPQYPAREDDEADTKGNWNSLQKPVVTGLGLPSPRLADRPEPIEDVLCNHGGAALGVGTLSAMPAAFGLKQRRVCRLCIVSTAGSRTMSSFLI